MKRKNLQNKILQQLYKPRSKNLWDGIKKIDELNKVIDDITKKIFNKKEATEKK